ncbi:MAG: class II glutamine amidotransferase, partial [Candidatus Baldrarchaeia archaeon]
MCELLGMCFNMPVQPKISFRAFRRRGRENPDGWGIAFYPDSGNAACVFKEPLEAMSSRLSEFIAGY